MTIEGVKAILETSQSSMDWSNNCDIVKGMNEGRYPDFWWHEIIQSGFADKIMARWGGDTKIRIMKVG